MWGNGTAIVCISACAYVTYHVLEYIYTWLRVYAGLRHLPRPPFSLLGVPTDVLTNRRHDALLGLTKSLGSVFYCRMIWHQVLIIADPSLAMEVFCRPEIGKTDFFYKEFEKTLGSTRKEPDIECARGGGGPDDAFHRALRKGLAPSFGIQEVRKKFDCLVKSGEALVSLLTSRGSTEPIEISHALMCATFDTIGRFGFQMEMGAIESLKTAEKFYLIKELDAANAYVDALMGNPALAWLPFLPMHRQGKQALAVFHNFTRDMRDQVLARGPAEAQDISPAAQLMRIQDPHGQPLSPTAQQAMVNDLFWGGYDTTGTTLGWTLFLIATNPEVEEKVKAELAEVGLLASPSHRTPRLPEWSDIAQLRYLNAVVKESLRLVPATAMAGPRTCRSGDIQLSNGLIVPRGTIIYPPVYLVHHDPSSWHEPSRFLPERWLEVPPSALSSKSGVDADVASSQPQRALLDIVNSGQRWEKDNGKGPIAWMPFLTGRRDCPAKVFAETSMLATLAILLGNFTFRLADRMGKPEEVIAGAELLITLQPRDGMWLHAVPRAAATHA